MTGLRPLLRRDESYAVHTLIYLAENPGSATARVARELAIPPAFLAKVVRRLVAAGLLRSRTGRGGGIEPQRPLDELSLLDVVEAISGPVVMDLCQAAARCATERRRGHCHLKRAWAVASARVRMVLQEVRLGELAELPAEGGP